MTREEMVMTRTETAAQARGGGQRDGDATGGVVVGAYARVDARGVERVRARLDRLRGVETFPLERYGTVGLLVEADDIDAAQGISR